MANKKKKSKRPDFQPPAEPKKTGGSAYTPPKAEATPARDAPGAVSPRSAAASWIVLGLGLIVVVGFIGFSILNSRDESGSVAAESFDLPGLDGQDRVTLAEFSGTPVVLNFYASWCTTCETELPVFREAAETLEGEVAFVFVNSNENASWRGMASRASILDQRLARDINGSGKNGLYESLGGRGGAMPITAFYDGNGNVVRVRMQGYNRTSLQAELQDLFGVTF